MRVGCNALSGCADLVWSPVEDDAHGRSLWNRKSDRGAAGAQGILGVFLREPLADWQREARLLRASFRARGGEPPPDEDTHVALKVHSPEQHNTVHGHSTVPCQ